MNKIEIDSEKLKKTIRKAIPWVIGSGAIIAGSIILYKRGFLKGVHTGMHHGVDMTIKRITDHLGESVNNFCMYNNSNGVPVIIKGAAVVSETDIPAAVNLINTNCADVTAEVTEKVTKSLTAILKK